VHPSHGDPACADPQEEQLLGWHHPYIAVAAFETGVTGVSKRRMKTGPVFPRPPNPASELMNRSTSKVTQVEIPDPPRKEMGCCFITTLSENAPCLGRKETPATSRQKGSVEYHARTDKALPGGQRQA